MPILTIPNRFVHGETITAAKLNANFQAIADLFNTTKLGQDNFRIGGGVGNERKANWRSWTALIAQVPSITAGPSTTVTFNGLAALAHWPQYARAPTGSVTLADGAVHGEAPLIKDGLVKLGSLQGCYRGAATNLDAGDTLTARVEYRKRLGPALTTVNLNIKSPNLLVETAINIDDVEYVQVAIELVTNVIAGTRTVPRPFAVLWLSYPHIP